ncbi:MAG: mannose-1-phosphate guanylyltransferase/mannose-6-phosphate isomerase [Pseudohongiellaceae bacterium]
MIPVILSGGAGTRLWPLSRKHYPKQLHRLTGGEHTLLQETALRVTDLQAPIVVCNEDHRFMVAEQLRSAGVTPSAILLEPAARNTAPAIALAALQALQTDPEATLAVLPADHAIADHQALLQALDVAGEAAADGSLVTFGVVPTHPETGYGYLQSQEKSGNVRHVIRFVEKPDHPTAEQYLAAGDHFWNSGMFVFRARAYLDALMRFQPTMAEVCREAFENASTDLDFIRISKAHFSPCPSDSIDYAVMEQAEQVRMVPLDAGWSDVGGWHSLWEISDKDENGNVSIGDVLPMDSHNNLVHSREKLVVTLGMEDTVIVDTKDALLVARRDRVQQVKDAVEKIRELGRKEHLNHREVHRPWGSYDSIDNGERYQVKCITVKPGASLSLQMHHHRAEHWVVVSGTAIVQIGEREQMLTENESVYIPIGEKHRLTNPGKLPLELIEVQSGSYLGEDDIVRFEDNFGRC